MNSLTAKINSLIVATALTAFVIFTAVDAWNNSRAQTEQLNTAIASTALRLSKSLANPLWNFDIETVDNLILVEMNTPDILAINLTNLKANELNSCFQRAADGEIAKIPPPPTITNPTTRISSQIFFNSKLIATFEILATDKIIRAKIAGDLRNSAYKMLFFLFLICATISILIYTFISRPINNLIGSITRIATGNLDIPIDISRSDELGILARAFSHMTKQLKTSFDELENRVINRTAELEKAKTSAETASKAKSSFLASMSHELRTPLNAILGFSQIMAKDQAATHSQKENIAIILKSGEHLLTLINSVLDLAKIESGKIQVEPEEFDLAILILDLIAMLRGRAEAKGLRLLLDQSSSFPRFIKSDPAKLRQILINLIGNAIKFTEQGEVGVKLAVLALNHGTDRLELAFDIVDTGPGMTPEDLERIFQPFEQAKQKTSTEGTGLGLAIAREYTTMLGGTISATSELGRGATFHFTIIGAAVKSAHITAIHQLQGDIVAIDHATDCRILVVEDQLENRLLLKQLLAPYNFQYREAMNGEEGVAISRQWQPHCILMDRRMPVMDGLTATRAIRELDLAPRPVIIGVTAHAYREEQAEMFTVGCDDFLGKPFKENDLFNTFAKHLPITIHRATPQAGPPTGAAMSAGTDAADLPAILASLPAAVLSQLQAAAIRCDLEQITTLLAPYPKVEGALKPLLDSFRFDSLVEAIDRQLHGENNLPATK